MRTATALFSGIIGLLLLIDAEPVPLEFLIRTGQSQASAAEPGRSRSADRAGSRLDAIEQKTVDRSNQQRKKAGLNTLPPDETLQKTAEYFAAYLAENDKFSHEADGRHPWERAEDNGYEYCYVAENLAYHKPAGSISTDKLAKYFVDGWMKSKSHRENLLHPDVDEMAVAVAHNPGTDKYFAVQMFGRPRSRILEFTVINQTSQVAHLAVDKQSFDLRPGARLTFQRCLTPELALLKEPAKENSTPAAGNVIGEVVRPERDATYLVSTSDKGQQQLAKEAAEESVP